MQVRVQTGDVFATENPMALGKAINLAQAIWSPDGKSTYSHAGIIVDSSGNTLEALWTVSVQNLFKDYAGKKVIVARPLINHKVEAIGRIWKEHKGDWYPFWRLLFHIIPPVAKYTTLGGRYLVCSELVAKYLHYLGARHGRFTGTNPDTLADEWKEWKNYEVIFEGTLDETVGE